MKFHIFSSHFVPHKSFSDSAMEFNLVMLTIFFLQAFSYQTSTTVAPKEKKNSALQNETFIKSVQGKTNIECDQNSIIVTNETTILKDCNLKISCLIPAERKIHYVCVLRKFFESNCQVVDMRDFPPSTGCFVSRKKGQVVFYRQNYPHKYLHFLFFYKKLDKNDGSDDASFYYVFSYERLEFKKNVDIDQNCWFLLKVSNESKEDFREFFAKYSQITTQVTTEGINTFSMITIPKESDRLILGDQTSSTTVAPNEKKVHKVFIILGVVVLVLLTIFLLAAYAFYRKRSQNETVNGINEIPLSENERLENILAEDTVTSQKFNDHLDILVDNVLYQATTSVDRSQQKAQNNEYADASGAVYAEVNEIKEINNNHPMNPGDSSHVEVNGDIHTLVNKEEAI